MTRINLKGARNLMTSELDLLLSRVASERDSDFELLDKHYRESYNRIEFYRNEFQSASSRLKARFDEDLATLTNFYNNLINNETIRLNDLSSHINSITDDSLGAPKAVEEETTSIPKLENGRNSK